MNQESFSGDYGIDEDNSVDIIKIKSDDLFVDDVLVYVKGNKRLILEKKIVSGANKKGCLFMIAIIISLYVSALFLRFISGGIFYEQSPLFSSLVAILTFPLIFFGLLAGIKEKLFKKDALDRVIIDKDRGIIRFETEKKEELKLNAQYSTSVVNRVRRDKQGIHLDFHPNSTTEPSNTLQITWYMKDPDNEGIIKLAHRIGEFLGVPVIEKT
jgi:hypothetical protein